MQQCMELRHFIRIMTDATLMMCQEISCDSVLHWQMDTCLHGHMRRWRYS